MKRLLLSIAMMLVLGLPSTAQSVERKGNNFIAKSKGKTVAAKDSIKTEYTYTNSKGQVYTVYLSSTGKAYIRTSPKAGAKGRRYMPEIGKVINPKAYKEKK